MVISTIELGQNLLPSDLFQYLFSVNIMWTTFTSATSRSWNILQPSGSKLCLFRSVDERSAQKFSAPFDMRDLRNGQIQDGVPVRVF
jgi:hypothetical protein